MNSGKGLHHNKDRALLSSSRGSSDMQSLLLLIADWLHWENGRMVAMDIKLVNQASPDVQELDPNKLGSNDLGPKSHQHIKQMGITIRKASFRGAIRHTSTVPSISQEHFISDAKTTSQLRVAFPNASCCCWWIHLKSAKTEY